MWDRVYPNKVFYEIIGGKKPFIYEFTVTEFEILPDGSVYFPRKAVGLCCYEQKDTGISVFEDFNSAYQKLRSWYK